MSLVVAHLRAIQGGDSGSWYGRCVVDGISYDSLPVATCHKEERMTRITLLVNSPRRDGCAFQRGSQTVLTWRALMISVRRLAKSENGQDLLEYAMLASLIAIFALAAVKLLGDQIGGVLWGAVANNF
jgi:Flp pilus assembly pilin Flp